MQEITVRIISDYQNHSVESWLKQQSQNGDKCFINKDFCVRFTTQNRPSDYCLMINKVDQNTTIHCPTHNIWGLQQEPFIAGSPTYAIPFKNEFAKKSSTYSQCSKVYAFVEELLKQSQKFIPSPPFIYWLIEGGGDRQLSFYDLQTLNIQTKTRDISCIANLDKKAFAGHIKRTNFIRFLQRQKIAIDYFGGEKTHNFIQTKLEALIDYKYSIAIENSVTPLYFSEKITDCFLAGCMPIYYGAPNITDFFPKESLIQIDILKPQEAFETIQEALSSKLWEKNFDAIVEAKRRCMHDYNLIENIGQKVIEDFLSKPSQEEKQTIIIKGYKRSFFTHIHRNLQRIYYKIRYFLNF